MPFLYYPSGRILELPLKRALKRVKEGDAEWYEGPHPTDPDAPDIDAPKLPVKKFVLPTKLRAARARMIANKEAALEAAKGKKQTPAQKQAQAAKAKESKADEEEGERVQEILQGEVKDLELEDCQFVLDKFQKDYHASENTASLRKRVAELQREMGELNK
jgi:hypothetical protein